MLPALIFSLIPSSHMLPAPQATGLQHTDGGAGEEWGGGLPFTETLLVLSIQGEVQGELPMGRRGQWAEGSPGAKVKHTV